MWSGKGVSGNRTTSSGNRGSRGLGKTPPPSRRPATGGPSRFYSADLTSLRTSRYKQRMASGKNVDLTGRVVVVTGASMGIGEALARIFAAHGASVVLSSRDAVRSEAARQRIGHTARTLALSCDVRNREEIDKV